MNAPRFGAGGDAAEIPWSVAYVLTHYPRVALTFIAGEVDEIERLGGHVLPIVMNLPQASDLATPDAKTRYERSLYLRSSPISVALALIGTLLRHPIQGGKLFRLALRSARSDLGLMARRVVHLGYGALAAQHCRQRAIRHLHAQFGQSPATIAWFAAEIMKFSEREACGWSFTIHGFQDFVDEAVARLDLKAASAAFVICVSDFTRSQLSRVADPKYWDRFQVIRCGIDLGAFPLRPARPLGAPPRILIVGRLSPEKGHLILLRALRMVLDQGLDAEVEIVGAGPFERAIRGEAASLGLDGKVTFAGELPHQEVALRLAQADIFCMASFSEGLPISIMEAMAVGVPVVTTWISGIPELAVDGVTALTVPPGNCEALAEAIGRVVGDAGLREVLIASARASVERLHSRERAGAALAGLFRMQPTIMRKQGGS